MAEKKRKPVAQCTRCHRASTHLGSINTVCGLGSCNGFMRSRIGPDDWTECKLCSGVGNHHGLVCGFCEGVGWIAARQEQLTNKNPR